MRTKIYIVLALVLIIGLIGLFQRVTRAGAAQDPEFVRKLNELNQMGESPAILGEQATLGLFTAEQVQSLLVQPNRYLKAAAIAELKRREDPGAITEVQTIFDTTPLNAQDIQFDPHAPLTPGSALMVSSAEYLATFEKNSFLPLLLGRQELWQAPFLFVPTFQTIGQEWINPAIAAARDPRQQAALHYLIVAAVTPQNAGELSEILRTQHGLFWEAAANACDGLGTKTCMQGLEASLGTCDESERLLGWMILRQHARATDASILEAASAVARRAGEMPVSAARLKLIQRLISFAGFVKANGLMLPERLLQEIHAVGSQTLMEELQFTAVDKRR